MSIFDNKEQLKEMEETLQFLINWGVPQEKAKKMILRHNWSLSSKEANEIFTDSPLTDERLHLSAFL
ncbi:MULTISPECIES: hypothetical protein [unclassified Desulfovibrio]|uniref:hypothetical protein n=1 Tax=unclassified Desulfovibrio TaxID=2593640 RepID=UPI0013EB7EE6|nr:MULTISPECIES: hypothetical protein [unclassified Desulfovibrio]